MLHIGMEGSAKFAEAIVQDLDLCWPSRDPGALENLFRARLAEYQNGEGTSAGSQAELLTQIARAQAAQGRLSEARQSLDNAAKILGTPELAIPVKVKIRLLLEEGRLMILLRTPSQARPRFAAAWELAVKADEDFFIIDIARMMAEIEPMKLQEEWLRKAIETAERSREPKARRWLGWLYADLGWRIFDLRQYEAALEAHRQSLAGHQKAGSPADALGAQWAVARLLRQLGRVPEALAAQNALLLETGTNSPLYGRICEEMAECLLALKQLEAARAHFARAHEELSRSTWIPDRHPLRLKRLKDLGKVE